MTCYILAEFKFFVVDIKTTHSTHEIAAIIEKIKLKRKNQNTPSFKSWSFDSNRITIILKLNSTFLVSTT